MIKTALFIGLTTIDIQYFVEEYPNANKKVKTNPPDILVGGPATNAAVAFAYLNGNASLATAVGNNSFEPFINKDLQGAKIGLFDLVQNKKFNPILASVITSANGDRTIFTHNPAKISPGLTPKQLFDKTDPRILLLDGFYPEFSLECAKLAKKQNIPVVIDAGSWKPQYDKILNYTDIAICSSDFFPPGCRCSGEVFSYLKKHGVKYAAISQGKKNILFREGENFGEIAIEEVQVKDTLGAGDFLHGAFCYYFLGNGNFEEALYKASIVASKSCRHAGTRSWLNY